MTHIYSRFKIDRKLATESTPFLLESKGAILKSTVERTKINTNFSHLQVPSLKY